MQLGLSTCGTLKNVETGPASLDTFLDFTDGACEGDSSRVGSGGGVLVDPFGCCRQHFSSEVPVDFMRRALACPTNSIYELGLLPIYIALYAWGGILKSTHLVCYLDNDAARAALCEVYGSIELAQHSVGCAHATWKVFQKQSLGTQGYLHTLTSLMVQADWTSKRWGSWGRNKSR